MSLRSDLFTTGIRRLGSQRNGLRFRRANGRRISTADARRIEALRIPPAWTQVHIAASPDARLQVVGCDAAGRWQYLYHPVSVARRSRARFDHLIDFGAALPRLRRTLARDLARPGLPRDKALACAVALLTTCFLRPGTEIYAAENGTFGLATLRDRHVLVEGNRIRLDFRGKHRQRQRHEVRNAKLARIVATMKRLPGREVFKFVEAAGNVHDLRGEHLNKYIKQVMGKNFSARAFRTWGGTLLCAGALARAARRPPATKARTAPGAAARRAVLSALRETAAHLGNTMAVCRRSYVHPNVLRAFERGRTVTAALSRPEALIAPHHAGLDRSERALLALLRRERKARAS